MGKYLDILKQAGLYERTDCAISAKSAERVSVDVPATSVAPFSRLSRFSRTLSALETHCPEHVPVIRWQQCVEDGRVFLSRWGEQAEALGWTERDLFGLHTPPENPHPSYSRLSRYGETGLIWLLRGRPVVALSEAIAAIQNPTGNTTIYRKNNKLPLGPEGDSLDDLH